MSPFIAMALTGLAAGLLVPIIATASATLGICEPFSLQIAGRKWTFGKTHPVHQMVAANTCFYMEAHMTGGYAYVESGRSFASVSKTQLAA